MDNKDSIKKIEATLEFISKNGYENDGNKFLKSVSKYLAKLFAVDYILIDKYSIKKPAIAETLVLYGKDGFLPNISYKLVNTPCENVINKKVCVYTTNIKKIFPKDEFLKRMNIDSYIGIPLWSCAREPIGLLTIMDSKPIKDSKTLELCLQIVALKLEKVLEKMLFENILKLQIQDLKVSKEKIKKSEAKFKKLSNLTFEGILIHDNGIAIDMNLSFAKIFGYNRKELIGENIINLLFSNKHHTTISERIKDYTFPYEIEGIKKDGSTFPVEIEARDFIEENNKTFRVVAVRDITERKKAKKKLHIAYDIIKENEDYFSTILRKTNEGFWTINNEAIVLEVNPEMCKILGYPESKILGKSIFEFVDKENSKIFKEQLKKRKAGLSTRYEIELLRRNGKNVPCLFNTSLIYNKENTIIGSFALVANISKLKNTYRILENKNEELKNISNELSEKNRLLLESKNRFRSIFEQSPVSLWEEDFSDVIQLLKEKYAETNDLEAYFDENPKFVDECISKIKILSINKETLRLLGIKRKEDIITSLSRIFNKKSHEIFKKELLALASNKTEFSGETEFIKSDGTVSSAILKLVIIDDNAKAIVSMIDITALKKAKEKAEENEYFLLESQKIANIGSYKLDFTLGIWESTSILDDIFGIDKEYTKDIKGWLKIIHSEDQTKMQEYFTNNILNLKEPFNMEYRIVKINNQKECWVHGLGELEIDDEGNLIRMSGTIQDVTINKRINQELLNSKEKAEESNRLKTEFLNNMSHEIRTPMNGILGFSQFLSNPNLTVEKRENFINIIQNSGKQLLHIIDDIIEISRLGTNQVTLLEKEVCLNDLLLELFSIVDIKAKEKKIPLYFKKGLSDEQSILLTDKTKLNKIVSNLLENALKFTNIGFIEFGYQLKNNNEFNEKGNATVELEIYVKDTGIGIKPKNHELIFERFSQAEKELSKNVGGLGLGLSIAKENAELLGGKISVESEMMEGATFFVTIPYKPVNIGTKITDQKITITNKKTEYTILIVEDEEVNYLFLEILLMDKIKLPCNILHARDGQEAVEFCKNNPDINFVLMDIKMPKLNGHEATKLIKEFRPNLPIVAQTAYSTLEDKEMAFTAGCNDFITKPIRKEDLKKALDLHLINYN